jgi:hypothetical protein
MQQTILESCQRAVALQRLSQRRGALGANRVLVKTMTKMSIMWRRNNATPPFVTSPLLESCQRAVALKPFSQRRGALSGNVVV